MKYVFILRFMSLSNLSLSCPILVRLPANEKLIYLEYFLLSNNSLKFHDITLIMSSRFTAFRCWLINDNNIPEKEIRK